MASSSVRYFALHEVAVGAFPETLRTAYATSVA
jgi:hypothetical protein